MCQSQMHQRSEVLTPEPHQRSHKRRHATPRLGEEWRRGPSTAGDHVGAAGSQPDCGVSPVEFTSKGRGGRVRPPTNNSHKPRNARAQPEEFRGALSTASSDQRERSARGLWSEELEFTSGDERGGAAPLKGQQRSRTVGWGGGAWLRRRGRRVRLPNYFLRLLRRRRFFAAFFALFFLQRLRSVLRGPVFIPGRYIMGRCV